MSDYNNCNTSIPPILFRKSSLEVQEKHYLAFHKLGQQKSSLEHGLI